MSKHTKGPWAVETDAKKLRHDGRIAVHQANRGDAYSLVATIEHARDVPLITAAPDLLAVVQRWLRIMGAAGADKCGCNPPDSYVCCRCEVEAALTKARGGK